MSRLYPMPPPAAPNAWPVLLTVCVPSGLIAMRSGLWIATHSSQFPAQQCALMCFALGLTLFACLGIVIQSTLNVGFLIIPLVPVVFLTLMAFPASLIAVVMNAFSVSIVFGILTTISATGAVSVLFVLRDRFAGHHVSNWRDLWQYLTSASSALRTHLARSLPIVLLILCCWVLAARSELNLAFYFPLSMVAFAVGAVFLPFGLRILEKPPSSLQFVLRAISVGCSLILLISGLQGAFYYAWLGVAPTSLLPAFEIGSARQFTSLRDRWATILIRDLRGPFTISLRPPSDVRRIRLHLKGCLNGSLTLTDGGALQQSLSETFDFWITNRWTVSNTALRFVPEGVKSGTCLVEYQYVRKDPILEAKVRDRLRVAELLVAEHKEQIALEVYQQLLRDFPDFPERLDTLRKALPLASKLEKPETEDYVREIEKLTPSPSTNASAEEHNATGR